MYLIGQGIDVHAFDTNSTGPLVLGGVVIDHKHKFLAHSDGDVLIHAICDALLGALALGDIGKHFPNTDPKYKNIDSKKLLSHVVALVNNEGFTVVNIDCTVLCERPKLLPHIDKMREVLASILNIESRFVSVKATTNEKLGYIGREEGVTAHAVCLLKRL